MPLVCFRNLYKLAGEKIQGDTQNAYAYIELQKQTLYLGSSTTAFDISSILKDIMQHANKKDQTLTFDGLPSYNINQNGTELKVIFTTININYVEGAPNSFSTEGFVLQK